MNADFQPGVVDILDIYVEILSSEADIDDLYISVETNNAYWATCFGFLGGGALFFIGLISGVIFLILFLKKRSKGDARVNYAREIKDLEKKIEEMEGLGMDTRQERKLLKDYKNR